MFSKYLLKIKSQWRTLCEREHKPRGSFHKIVKIIFGPSPKSKTLAELGQNSKGQKDKKVGKPTKPLRERKHTKPLAIKTLFLFALKTSIAKLSQSIAFLIFSVFRAKGRLQTPLTTSFTSLIWISSVVLHYIDKKLLVRVTFWHNTSITFEFTI